MQINAEEFRCGFIAIIGRPNVGKSTLMNHLIKKKISITSRKSQTTRHLIRGIYTGQQAQFIFVDTPGLQTVSCPKFRATQETLKTVDCILMVVEVLQFSKEERRIIDLLPKHVPVILVINKVDQIRDKERLAEFIENCSAAYHFFAIQSVSAKHHQAIDSLKQVLQKTLPVSPPLYDTLMQTDQSERFLASEIVQEKLFRYFSDEIPYRSTVTIEQFKKQETIYHIYATIQVEKNSQKGILIGKDGEKLKKIATEARMDMEKLFDSPVFLKVWVKTKAKKNDEVHE